MLLKVWVAVAPDAGSAWSHPPDILGRLRARPRDVDIFKGTTPSGSRESVHSALQSYSQLIGLPHANVTVTENGACLDHAHSRHFRSWTLGSRYEMHGRRSSIQIKPQP